MRTQTLTSGSKYSKNYFSGFLVPFIIVCLSGISLLNMSYFFKNPFDDQLQHLVLNTFLTLFRMGEKKTPYQFPFVSSTSIRSSPQTFLTFSFNSFATLEKNFKAIPHAISKLLNLNQQHPSKNLVFW